MNQLTRFDTTTLNKALIGFDRLFNNVEQRFASSIQNYPPYNVLKTGEDDYVVEVAVTGFEKDEVTVVVDQDQLVITAKSTATESDAEYLHRGLANRDFERRFTLAEHLHVGPASISNGLLKIMLKRVVPEALKARTITID